MMKYFMRFVQDVDRLQQALWFINNYQDIGMRQEDIDWIKGHKRHIYDEYHTGMQITDAIDGFIWVCKDTPRNYFIINNIKEVFYNPNIITLGELSCTI